MRRRAEPPRSVGRARERRGDVQRRSAPRRARAVTRGSGAGLEVRALPHSLLRLLISDVGVVHDRSPVAALLA